MSSAVSAAQAQHDLTNRRIRFKAEPLKSMFAEEAPNLIIMGGAITTTARLARFECSLAHLCKDGLIRRFLEVIGNADDIEYLEDAS